MIEPIGDALAALRPETRKKMIEELDVAFKDTLVEFLETNCVEAKTKLQLELASLERFSYVAKKVDAEYDEIQRRSVPR